MNRIKENFDQVHANQEMIDSTKSVLREMRLQIEKESQIERKHPEKDTSRKTRPRIYRALSSAVACLLVIILLFGAGYYYQVNAKAFSYISIDANPSIELSLNEKGRVLEVEAYNSAGEAILSHMDLQGMTYEKAIACIMNHETMKEYLVQDSNLNFTIISREKEHAQGIQKGIKSHQCLENHHGVKIIYNKRVYEDVYEKAHASTMSFGKYYLFMKLQEYDSSVTVEECHDMSIGEIEERIHCHENHEVNVKEDDNHKQNNNGNDSKHNNKKKESEQHNKKHSSEHEKHH